MIQLNYLSTHTPTFFLHDKQFWVELSVTYFMYICLCKFWVFFVSILHVLLATDLKLAVFNMLFVVMVFHLFITL